MKAPVTHINLLQRAAPAHTVALSLAGLLIAALLGAFYYGNGLRTQANDAQRQRDDVARQLKSVQQEMAVKTGEQARSAQAVGLRKQIDALQPRAQVAQSLLDAVRGETTGKTADLSRVLTTMTGLGEPGLWLTTLTVGGGGKQLELQGAAADGAAVLRYANRANQSLQPLALRLDSLEVMPGAPGVAASGAAAGVTFRLR